MTTNERTVDALPATIWEILADGWLYPLWVVGASRMRQVDAGWPAVGSRLHHSVGTWPVLLDDTTEVLEVEEGRRIRLRARAWPGGEAEVELTLVPRGAGTLVRIFEDAVSGPGRLIPKPVRGPAVLWRNAETLRRLAFVAENRP